MLTLIYTLCKYLISPPFCISCKRYLQERVPLCVQCTELIKPALPVQVPLVQHSTITVYAVSLYEDPIKSLILAKARSHRIASVQLAELIWQFTPLQALAIDYFVPVPLHWTRLAWRGYNQATVIAELLARKKGVHVKHALKRVRKTAFQSSKTQAQRKHNVARVFQCSYANSQLYANKTIVLVDDLMTTGATLASAAQELLKLKPARIIAVVACRTER